MDDLTDCKYPKFYSTAVPQVCYDEDCILLHNDLLTDEHHHYGCECSDCLLFYWRLKIGPSTEWRN